MPDLPTPPTAPVPPWPAPPQARPASRGGRALKLAVGLGAAAGVAVGATALAQAATSSDGAPPSSGANVTASGSTPTTSEPDQGPGLDGPGRFGRFGGFPGGGGPGIGGGPFIYGQATIKGPNGYETLAERTGTVSEVTNTSGSTWSLVVKSADGTSGTFTVDSGTSVNGGEMGIGASRRVTRCG